MMLKRLLSLTLALVLVLGAFLSPELLHTTHALEDLTEEQTMVLPEEDDEIPVEALPSPEEPMFDNIFSASGSDYTSDPTLAAKLTAIFNGSVALFSNSDVKHALGSRLDVNASYSVGGQISGKQCYIYANGVYFYLFGDIPYHGSGIGSYWKNSSTVLTNRSTVSYNDFVGAGVNLGAYIRTTGNSDGSYNGGSGHSMIILSYDATYITVLDCNYDGAGLVRIGRYTWSDFNARMLTNKGRKVCHVVKYNGAPGTNPTVPSFQDVSIRSIDANSISIHVSMANAGLVRIVTRSLSTNESKTTDYTSNLGDVNYTFSRSSMSNPGRRFTIYIYAYSTASGGNEQLHRVTYGDELQVVTFPENAPSPGVRPSITNVSIPSIDSESITLRFSTSNAGLVVIDITSLETGQKHREEITYNLSNVTYTFSRSSMSNPGRRFTVYIYAYSTPSGGSEELHKVTYGDELQVVTFPAPAHDPTPHISWGMSNQADADPVTMYVGNSYYLSYRLFDAMTGKNWDQVSSNSYTVKLTVYKPNGSVHFTYTYSNDSNWIRVYLTEAGDYTAEVVLDGDFLYSGTRTYTVHSDPMKMNVSQSSVSLTMGSRESTEVRCWTTGFYDGGTYLNWRTSNDNVTCSWGEWGDDDSIPLTIYAQKPGSATVTVSVGVVDTEIILDRVEITVTVTSNSYTISFNANGGTGAPSSMTKAQGTALTLPTDQPARFPYNFLGWASSSSASSAAWLPGGSFNEDRSMTLYAVWKSPSTVSNTFPGSYNADIAFGGQVLLYKFVPSASDVYVFQSTGSEDTYGYLYSSSGTKLAYNDDSGDGQNFKLQYELTGGTTYYLGVKYYSSSKTGRIPFTVTREHNYTSAVTAPTCTAQGYTTHTCSLCGTSYRDTYTAALGHSYTYRATKNPTTSASGTLTGTCSRCSGATTVTLPKLDTTNYTKTTVKAATCSSTGTDRYTWKTTTYGTFYFDVTTAKTSHNYTTKVTNPTCTAQGYTDHTCTVCGDTYRDSYTAALGHSYTYRATKNPTTSASGTLTGTCSRCSGTTTVTLPKLDTTNYTKSSVKAATCTAGGTDRYTWKTTTYGTFYFDVTTAALGHYESPWITDREADCVNEGVMHTECLRCGQRMRSGSSPTTDHTQSGWIVDQQPDCVNAGSRHKACTVCGQTLHTEAIPALGHSWNNGTVVTQPTPTTPGVKVYVCTRCMELRSETIPPTAPSNPFTDVKDTDWFRDAVLWAVGSGITSGTSATTFSPNAVCTRSQVVTLLWRAAGQPEPKSTSNPFTDVKSTDYFFKAVLWAVEQGITSGTGGSQFGSNVVCTRSQVVTFLWRAAGQPEPKSNANPFGDVKQTDYFYKAVLWAVEQGITSGTGGGFAPLAQCTRSQVVTFLWKAYN